MPKTKSSKKRNVHSHDDLIADYGKMHKELEKDLIKVFKKYRDKGYGGVGVAVSYGMIGGEVKDNGCHFATGQSFLLGFDKLKALEILKVAKNLHNHIADNIAAQFAGFVSDKLFKEKKNGKK